MLRTVYEARFRLCNHRREVDSYALAESAARRGEVYIGYRHMDAADGRVVVNPPRDEPLHFVSENQIVVIAEN